MVADSPKRPRAGHPGPSGATGAPTFSVMAGAGMELAGVLVVLTALGWWLDMHVLGTKPWLTLAGAGLGIVGGLYRVWRQSKQWFAKSKDH